MYIIIYVEVKMIICVLTDNWCGDIIWTNKTGELMFLG